MANLKPVFWPKTDHRRVRHPAHDRVPSAAALAKSDGVTNLDHSQQSGVVRSGWSLSDYDDSEFAFFEQNPVIYIPARNRVDFGYFRDKGHQPPMGRVAPSSLSSCPAHAGEPKCSRTTRQTVHEKKQRRGPWPRNISPDYHESLNLFARQTDAHPLLSDFKNDKFERNPGTWGGPAYMTHPSQSAILGALQHYISDTPHLETERRR